MNIKKMDVSEVTLFFYFLIRVHRHLTFKVSRLFILNCIMRGCLMGCWFRGSSCTDPTLFGYAMFCNEAVKEVENAFVLISATRHVNCIDVLYFLILVCSFSISMHCNAQYTFAN